jgi:hypothetical protein
MKRARSDPENSHKRPIKKAEHLSAFGLRLTGFMGGVKLRDGWNVTPSAV